MSSDDFIFQRWRSADRDFWNHEQGSNSLSVEACNRLAARAWLRIVRQGLITVVDQSFSFQSALPLSWQRTSNERARVTSWAAPKNPRSEERVVGKERRKVWSSR